MKACDEQKKNLSLSRRSLAEAKRSVLSARKSLDKVGQGIDALAAFAASHVARAKQGNAKLALIKRQHTELLSRGARAAEGASGELGGVERALKGVDDDLVASERHGQAIEEVVDAAQIVLKGSQ